MTEQERYAYCTQSRTEAHNWTARLNYIVVEMVCKFWIVKPNCTRFYTYQKTNTKLGLFHCVNVLYAGIIQFDTARMQRRCWYVIGIHGAAIFFSSQGLMLVLILDAHQYEMYAVFNLKSSSIVTIIKFKKTRVKYIQRIKYFTSQRLSHSTGMFIVCNHLKSQNLVYYNIFANFH